MRNLFANVCLLLGSCVAGLALCEVSLRLFYPKYRHLAEAQFSRDAERIWGRMPHWRDFRRHPDTGALHFLHYNNLGLRQHRNFSAADLAAATNVGVFGDSFTENTGMPVPYSFTEPLDYLLNRGQQRFNVLNFGVDAYGPGQSLLHYEHFRHAADLDHVLYVYCRNDIEEIYATGLFHLDEAGRLVRNEAIRPSWWVSFMSRLHIPYLALDATGRWSSFLENIAETTADINGYLKRGYDERSGSERYRAIKRVFRQGGPADDGTKNTLEIFRQLIRRWKHIAEQKDSTFSVVLLPSHPPQPFVVDLLTAEEVEVIDLYTCFGDIDPTHPQLPWHESPYRFKHDGHWNETGNRLAAVCLYRALEEKHGPFPLSEGELQESLFQYYAAFGADASPKGGVERSVSVEATAAIREKYLALDAGALSEEEKDEIRTLMAQQDKRIIASDFDVYLDGNRLLYVKEGCRLVDVLLARFFLHVIPVDGKDLPEHRRRYGFENRDFSQANLEIRDGRCVVQKRLPAYPIRRIRTGQFVKDAQGNFVDLWKGEFSTG